jgi:hypothetical protein
VSVDCIYPSPSAPQESFSFTPPFPSSSSASLAISSMAHVSPSKASTASVSSPSFLSKFSNVCSYCMVGHPEEDVDILRRLSQKFLNPLLVIDDNNKIISSNVPSEITLKDENKVDFIRKVEIMDDVPDSPAVKRSKSRRIEKVTNQEKIKSFKRSILCDDEDSNEEKRNNLKRKRECIDFVPCANPPFKSRKIYSSKVSKKPVKSILAKSKVLAQKLPKCLPKPPFSLPLGIAVVSNGLSELIEGDCFADSEANKTIVTHVLDVFKCPDCYMFSQVGPFQ